MPASILISVKPRFADPLVEGLKRTEVRKLFNGEAGDLLLIYSSSPRRALIGHARIRAVEELEVADLWRTRGHRTHLHETELLDYAGNRPHLVAIDVEDSCVWERPVPLAALRDQFNIRPPQSYRRIDDGVAVRLRTFGQAP